MFDELQLARLCFLDLVLRQRQREFALNVNKALKEQEVAPRQPQPRPQPIPHHRRFWHRSINPRKPHDGRAKDRPHPVTSVLES
jgi:hypothetical protein